MNGFVIVDRLNNVYGVFDDPSDAARWAIANFGDGDDWKCKPLRAPETVPEGECS